MYYCVATQVDKAPPWQWKSSVRHSLNTLFQLLGSFEHCRTISCWSSPQRERAWRSSLSARTKDWGLLRWRQHNF